MIATAAATSQSACEKAPLPETGASWPRLPRGSFLREAFPGFPVTRPTYLGAGSDPIRSHISDCRGFTADYSVAMRKIKFFLFVLLLQGGRAFAADQPGESLTFGAGQAAIKWKDKIIDFLMQRGPAVAGAVLVLVAGWIAASGVARLVERTLTKRQLEPPIRMLISRVLFVLVLAMSLIVALDTAGFKMTTLIAGISVVGVGVGLAMQGVLGNLVAGLVIIFTKPYRVGEFIDIIGEYGQVETIELFTTVLSHPDRSRLIIPNRKIVGEVLHNYGTIRQCDMSVGVSYDSNLPETLAIIRDVLRDNPRVLKEMAPGLGIAGLGDSSINIAVKPWVKVTDFGVAQAEVYEAIVQKFRSRNIEIPFPQREIRIVNGQGAKAVSAA
jgi:small conductance mechanosensitive channel